MRALLPSRQVRPPLHKPTWARHWLGSCYWGNSGGINGGETKINTLIIDSHGTYPDEQFKIGSIVITVGTSSRFDKLKTYLSESSSVVLLACHSGGNGLDQGESPLVEVLSKSLSCTVYGCKSWTGAAFLFSGYINVSQPDFSAARIKPRAWKYLGTWSKASCGSTMISLPNGINLSNIGDVMERTAPSKIDNASQKIVDFYNGHPKYQQRIDRAAQKIGKWIGL